jgi:MoxR-like ATPase
VVLGLRLACAFVTNRPVPALRAIVPLAILFPLPVHSAIFAHFQITFMSYRLSRHHLCFTEGQTKEREAMDPNKIIELVEAALAADYPRVRKVANVIARLMGEEGQDEAATALRSLMRKKGVPLRASGYMEQLPTDVKSRLPLVEEQEWPATPVFLNEPAHMALADFVSDARNIEEFSRNGLASRLAIMLSGPPGTGKSLLAGHIAAQLNRPLYVVRLDSLISSLLGDTAKNVRAIFDFIPTKNAVLFLDEIDAVAKFRDDRQELGELKRVVNTVIQGLDSLDDSAVVIAATNHPQLLDPAIWRRFPYQIEIGLPDENVREALWNYFLFGDSDKEGLGKILSIISHDLTGAEVERIALAARRRMLLSKGEMKLAEVAGAIINARTAEGATGQRRSQGELDNKELARHLQQDGLNAPQIAKLLGVSRQWSLRLLNEVENG